MLLSCLLYTSGGCSQRGARAGQAISDPVCGLAWRNPERRHGNQLCIRKTSVLYVYLQATGNIAFDSHIYSFDDSYIHSAGNPGKMCIRDRRVIGVLFILPVYETMECIVVIYIASWIAAGIAFLGLWKWNRCV